MKKSFISSKKALIALGVILPLIAGANETHKAVDEVSKTGTLPEKVQPLSREKESQSQYDVLAEKLDKWVKNSKDGTPAAFLVEDELTLKLSHDQLKSASESVKKIKLYRDAVDKQCSVSDDSARLLVQAIDSCLVSNVILPSINKAKIEQERYEAKLSLKAINTCQTELGAYFQEKEKRTDLTEKEVFKEDGVALKALSQIFEAFGGKKAKADSSVIESSELIKAVKKVEQGNLCQVDLKKENQAKEGSLPELSGSPKDKNDLAHKSGTSIKELPKSEYNEKIEETIEEEEQYIPIKAEKKVVEVEPAPKPVPQPLPQPAKQPVYDKAPVKQPLPFQPVPYQGPKRAEPLPAKPRNNVTPFIPAARPAPGRALVGGPGPVGPVPLFRPFGGGFGLSLGFGTYNSTVTATMPPPPPMPMMQPMAMPMMGGMGGMAGGLTGVSSGPRACLVCGSTPTPMPTLGLVNMLSRPCQVGRVGVQPVGACLPNMNQPVMGYGNVRPSVVQVPRYPGQPVNPVGPGVTPAQPSIGGGAVIPSRTTVPRTSSTAKTTFRRRGARR